MVKRDSYFKLQHDRTLKILFFLLFGAVIAGLFFIFRYYFWPFLFAVLLYMALQPVFHLLLGRIKKRGLASSILILFLVALVMVPLFFLAAAIIDQIFQLYTIVQEQIKAGIIDDIYNSQAVQKILAYLNIGKSDIISKATELVQYISGMLLSSVQALVAYPLNFIMNFFFMLLILFFMFKDGGNLGTVFYKTLPFPDDLEEKVITRLKEVIRVLLTGNIFIMIMQGVLVGLGLFMAGSRLRSWAAAWRRFFRLFPW
jgi:predicted PurR-regulated permease PerM